MRIDLQLHPDGTCDAVDRIEVRATRDGLRALLLSYAVFGRIDALKIPAPAAAMQADGLWRHTCFEVFVAAARGDAYAEFNLSPSGAWAAYQFDDYRAGMKDLALNMLPLITVERSADVLRLNASVELSPFTPPSEAQVWQLGLSAVIEETGGAKSYWAAAHPPGRPDFHDRDCFAVKLTARGGA